MQITAQVCEGLRALSRREGTTLFMTLMAAFKVLLYRYTGQSDIIVGSPIANRNHAEIEGLIGLFANIIALRTDLSGDPTFLEVLRREAEGALSAYARQDVPFEKIVEQLQPDRSLGRNPVIQVVLQMANVPKSSLELEGLHLELLGGAEWGMVNAQFDLAFHIRENSKGLRTWVVYNADLFQKSTIKRMVDHWENLLGEIVKGPGRRISGLEMVGREERRRLVGGWDDGGGREYPRGRSIHELFEEQAARRPEGKALEFEDGEMSYGELNEQANRLARRLRREGVGVETVVGVCLPRSAELIVCLLGVLKAGGAYLPLDEGYPEERLKWMVKRSGASLLVGRGEVARRLGDGKRKMLLLEEEGEKIGGESGLNMKNETEAENLAYVVFTSGSTGEPNGIGITHRGVVRLVVNPDYVKLDEEDAVMQGSSVSFDAATFEIWGALLNGARLVGVSQESLLTAGELGRRSREEGISAMFLTTALFNQKARHERGCFKGVRHVLFGGEAVDPQWVREVLGEEGPERLLHVYGPTEATTFSSWYWVRSVKERGTVPIGGPISRTQLYVVDGAGGLAAVGVKGELQIGGDGLARGYLNEPGLTAERFVPNAFEGVGGRLYRSGDVVRRLEDGMLEFVERRDYQVKIRGFRIEPGEIEWVLRQHAGVAEAVVTVWRPEEGEVTLVGYVTRSGAGPADQEFVAELKRFAAGRLPEYMLPTALIVLPEFPLNPNGKIDRKAFPRPDVRWAVSDGFVAPRTPEEELIAGIWKEVLAVDRIGIHDNFFDLGGHSLRATQLALRIGNALGMEVPLRELFDRPTVAGIANFMGAKMLDSTTKEEVLRIEQLTDEEVEMELKARQTSPMK